MSASLAERLATAWRTLRDTEQAGLLLRGPLPLWMQETFEREAERLDEPVGSVIFHALSDAARAINSEHATAIAAHIESEPGYASQVELGLAQIEAGDVVTVSFKERARDREIEKMFMRTTMLSYCIGFALGVAVCVTIIVFLLPHLK